MARIRRPRPVRPTNRAPRNTRPPAGVPLLDGVAGQIITPRTAGRGARNDLPFGFETERLTSQHHAPPASAPLRGRWWPFGNGDGGLPPSIPWPTAGGRWPWWLTRLGPLLLAAAIAGLTDRWLWCTVLAGLALAAGLHHYRIGIDVDSRTVRILYPAALIVACLAFASTPIWQGWLQPLTTLAVQAASDALTPDPTPATPGDEPASEAGEATPAPDGGGR